MKKLLHRNLKFIIACSFLCLSCEQVDQSEEVAKLKGTIEKYQKEVKRLNEELNKTNEKVDTAFINSFTIPEERYTTYKRLYEPRFKLLKDKFELQKGTRSVWFPLNQIKEYIKYTDSIAQEKNYRDLGLRFYFGVYDENYKKEEDIRETTLFYLPTTTSAVEKVNKTKSINSNQLMSSTTSSANINNDIPGVRAGNYGGIGGSDE